LKYFRAGKFSKPLLRPAIVAVVFIAAIAAPMGARSQQETSSDENKAAAEEILATFGNFQEFLKMRMGPEAAAIVSPRTIKYYGQVRVAALTASEEKLRRYSPADRVTILIMRVMIGKEALLGMTGKDLFAYVVQNKLIGYYLPTERIGAPEFKEGRATAPILDSEGKPTINSFEFSLHEGKWLFDFYRVVEAARARMPLALEVLGMTEDEFVDYVLEETTGETPNPNVWQPLTTESQLVK
jgi:hypothetical protein